MFVLVLNSTNLVQDGQNNKMIYRFPNSTVLTDKFIAVSNISMYYSWFNITSESGNNRFSYTWTVGVTTTTYPIIIPDGLWEISDINNFLQFNMIENGTYYIDVNGDFVYPIEIIVNTNRYAIQINTFLNPVNLAGYPAGASLPLNYPGFPTTTQNSVVTIPSRFNEIIGYSVGFATDANVGNAFVPPSPPTASSNFAAKNGAGTLSYLSNTNPNIQPNNNVLFSLSNINNPYTQPSSIIYSLVPSVGIGEQIYEYPPNFMWNKLIDGTYSDLRLTFLGNDLRPLRINDPNMTILLVIKDKNEIT
jgi:hypothetical protein